MLFLPFSAKHHWFLGSKQNEPNRQDNLFIPKIGTFVEKNVNYLAQWQNANNKP
jgi:hypothetical protein